MLGQNDKLARRGNESINETVPLLADELVDIYRDEVDLTKA